MSQENTRATFVMHKESRDLLKAVARRYGVTQSEIMNTAAFLYIALAERSLKRRRSDLGMLQTLADQAMRSIDSMPPHIVVGDVHELLENAIELERQSISKNQVHGPSKDDIYSLTQRLFPPFGDPFAETLITALEEVAASATVARYQSMLDADEAYDSFWDEEESERMKLMDIALDDMDFSAGESTITSPQSLQERVLAPHRRWLITLKEQEIWAETGADALEKVLKYLVKSDSGALEKLRVLKARTRRLVSDTPDGLYPGRPDLGDLSREFIPGWFMGTNHSSRDVKRWIRAAAEAVGLQWGIEIFAKESPA